MIEKMKERYKLKQPDWRGRLEKRFRWRTLRFEWGRWCYVVHPVDGGPDIAWWEWEVAKQ